jgi:general secretion pathway protein F/type IV pilus assembly protein PilC
LAATANFKYTARERTGGQVTGVLAAESLQEANRLLRDKALFPVRVEKAVDLQTLRPGRGRVSQSALATFYAQISDLLRSGVPLLKSLEILKRQSANPRLKEVLTDIHKRVAEGESVADAMKAHQNIFGELSVSMVRAGQEAGFLEDVFKRVSVFTEKQEELRGKVVGALTYPVVLIVIGCSVLSVLLIWFVPKFAKIFDRLRERGEMPALTEYLLGFSEFLQSHGIWLLAGIAVGIYFLKKQLATPAGRRWVDSRKVRIPVFGLVFRDLAITRFNRVLGTLRKNGVPILNALRIAKDSTGNVLMTEAIERAAENVKQGDKLATPLRKSGVFPEEIVEIIEVAEESNNLENVLIESADALEAQTTRKLDLAVRMLEPLSLVVMAAMTLVIVLALLLPIFNMSSSLGG